MKLEVSRRAIKREKQALKRAQAAGYTRSQAKTLLRRFYRSGNDDVAKLDDWIRNEELRRGNRRISTKKTKATKAAEFSESEIDEKEKELANRVLEGIEFGADLNDFGEIELLAAARSLGLNVRSDTSKEKLVKKIDEALCKPPECSREEPKWLKELTKKVNGNGNGTIKKVNKKVKVMKKKKKGTKTKKSYRKPNRQSEKSPVKKVVGVVQRVKKRTVTLAEILPFSMPKMF